MSVKQINNYIIVCLKEDAYNLGEEAVGVMMLYNKCTG